MLAAVNTQVTYVRDLRDAVTERRLTVGSSTFNHWYEFDNRGLLWKVFASTGAVKPAVPDVMFTLSQRRRRTGSARGATSTSASVERGQPEVLPPDLHDVLAGQYGIMGSGVMGAEPEMGEVTLR